MKKHAFSALACILVMVLLASMLPAGVLAAGDRIEISTASELRELSRLCRLDSWSVGKTVVLTKDIDLGYEEFEPIASFGGRFEGGGHSIKGLLIKANANSVGGLFRYVEEEGTVRELSVEGRIEPDRNGEGYGGIAGENRGEIINCSFHGSVGGKADIGGIVGVNASTGYISGCRSLGTVSGEHYTGGIAGRNLGSIFACTNLGGVNTSNPEIESTELNIDWTNLNSTENVAAHTDTGGIAGYSQGRLDSCVNRGSVGYPHVGYNVGGILGRQAGFMKDCRNFGDVNGRKDVGGVVGQMVPSITLHFSSTALSRLQTEMGLLEGLLDDMIADFEDSSNELSGILTDAGTYLKSAGESASRIGDSLVGFVDGNIENINDFAATAAAYIERLGNIVGGFEDCFGHLSAAAGELENFISALERGGEEFSEVIELANYAVQRLGEAENELNGALALCRSASSDIRSYAEKLGASLEQTPELPGEEEMPSMPDKEDIDDAVNKVQSGYEEFMTVAKGAIGKLDDALTLAESASSKVKDGVENGLEAASQKLADMDYLVEELTSPLEKAAGELGLASAVMGEIASQMGDWLTDMGRENTDIFEGLGQDFLDETDRMDAALLGLSGQMEELNQSLNGSVGTVSEDLRNINAQFFKVMDCFVEMLEGGEDVTLYEDMSEEELMEEADGKLQSCENRGEVSGDVNVGGVVGTVAVEYDLDPEEDISVSGTTGGSFRYFTKAVVLNCRNYDPVTGKKDAVGGVAGYMDLGVIHGCENYGEIKSLSGDYVGGIVGRSAAAVRNSMSLCALNGRDFVGGIAGSVDDISGCRAILRLECSGGYSGAIAGQVTGEAKENYFVSDTLGGIDGVSYSGKAQPLDYDSFMALGDMPGEFSDFKLTFATEDMRVKSVSFKYGESFDLNELPKVPSKTGYVGSWERFDYNRLTFSDTVMAVYTPYDTVTASEELEGKRSLLLLEGSFLPESVPVLSTCENAPENSIAAWTVQAVGTTREDYFIRFLRPESRRELAVYVLGENGWTQVGYETQTSYMVFPASGDSCSFAVVELERNIPWTGIYICVGAGIAAVIALLIATSRKKTKKPAHAG